MRCWTRAWCALAIIGILLLPSSQLFSAVTKPILLSGRPGKPVEVPNVILLCCLIRRVFGAVLGRVGLFSLLLRWTLLLCSRSVGNLMKKVLVCFWPHYTGHGGC